MGNELLNLTGLVGNSSISAQELAYQLEVVQVGLLEADLYASPLYEALDQFIVAPEEGDVRKKLAHALEREGRISPFDKKGDAVRAAWQLLAPSDTPTAREKKELLPPIAKPRTIEEILAIPNSNRLNAKQWVRFSGNNLASVANIRSPEEARLLLQFLATVKSDKVPLLKKAAQEALKYNIPIHWILDPKKEVSYVQRSSEEFVDQENRAAVTHGIFLRAREGVVSGTTFFHELAHSLPQKIVAEMFPAIPWEPHPTKADGYDRAVYKQLVRMSMQEAYAFALSHEGDLPDFK